MVNATPEREGVSIVLVGNFNPAIFNPDWLAARGLIRSEERDDSEIVQIDSNVAVFRAAWLELQVTRERFSAQTDDPSNFVTLAEMVDGLYTYLEHTPVSQMGLNTHRHFRLKDLAAWHALGDRLAPKEPWMSVLKGDRPNDIPGMRRLVMQGVREGGSSKRLQVTVEPSVQVTPGVYLSTNEHYESADSQSPHELMRYLKREWKDSLSYSSKIAQTLISETENG